MAFFTSSSPLEKSIYGIHKQKCLSYLTQLRVGNLITTLQSQCSQQTIELKIQVTFCCSALPLTHRRKTFPTFPFDTCLTKAILQWDQIKGMDQGRTA